MAFQREKGDPFDHLADINVTPLVDVMLVLLIIFMVTAPLLTVGVPIELPKSEYDWRWARLPAWCCVSSFDKDFFRSSWVSLRVWQ